MVHGLKDFHHGTGQRQQPSLKLLDLQVHIGVVPAFSL
jgi:hypothetical protein